MGVLDGKELLSSKYITAIIKDKSKRIFFITIKHMIDEFWLAEIDKQIYCFKLDDEIGYYRGRLRKSFQIVQYDISHYRPIKPEIKELELALRINDLPKVNGMMSDVFRILSAREKKPQLAVDSLGKPILDENGIQKTKPFTSHDLKKIVDEISNYKSSMIAKIIPKKQNRFQKQAESIVNYLNSLDIKQIVTPLKGISNFIEDDLKETDAKFFGSVAVTLQQLDHENKLVTNRPPRPSLSFVKWIVIFAIIAGIAIFVMWAASEGVFEDVLSFGGIINIPEIPSLDPNIGRPQIKNDPCGDIALQKKYTPEQLKIAQQTGENKCKLSPSMQSMVDGVKLPKVKANP